MTDVLHINASDLDGGAAIAAYRLHQALLRIGTDSRMLVGKKHGNDSTVDAFDRSRTPIASLTRRIRKPWLRRQLDRYEHRNLEFTDDRAADPAALVNALSPARVYNLHWVAKVLDHTLFFSTLPVEHPLVWTLHDMNPLTGGCHYAGGCRKFEAGCGACPMLASDAKPDLSSDIQGRKHRAYRHRRAEATRIVAPSRWLAAEACKSTLLRRFETVVIPHGLDAGVFRPHERSAARARFGLPHDMTLVMFVGQSLEFRRKGLDRLVAALNDLPDDNIGLLSVGGGRLQTQLAKPHFPVGEINDERLLAMAYSAADMFVTPAREEAFGQVVLEAMACGVPVVGFAVGGISDMVRPGVTGLLVSPDDVDGLARAIREVVSNDVLRAHMGRECRRVVLAEYRSELQAERYAGLYEELMAARGGAERFSARAASELPTGGGSALS